jgi:ABC-2 type transport system ATP-binding protein
VGYMPEERGLYMRMVLEEQMVFMAAIKGVGRKEATKRLGPWLERLGLAEWRKRKTNELSKGMQQKAQFIATVLHEPDLIIMDEPMSGLDPVGMDVMRDVMVDLSRGGATIVLSSHQMDTVERLCDRVALINKGEKLLDGTVSEVKAAHGRNSVVLAFEGDGGFLASLPGVAKVSDFGQYVEVQMDEDANPQTLLVQAAARLRIRRFEIVDPSLHDIFVETVTGHGKEAS